MTSPTLAEIVPLLQLAIGPVILISGVGLLLLSLTNRFGRVIDRSRAFAGELRVASPVEAERLRGQLAILWRRARIVRLAITLAALSVLLAALLVSGLFLAALWRVEWAGAVVALFIGCMATLVGALVAFLRDIHLSLVALRLELAFAEPPPAA
jgi:hypothetical protein